MLYALLATVFALSRLGYYLAGVRFDARPVLTYYQFIDPELLKHRLFESLWYLHVQPPGWNLFVGTALKIFPNAYCEAFHIVFLALGLGIGWLAYWLMRDCGVHRWIAFGLAAWFIVSPGTVLFENYLLYEYLVALLVLGAAVLLAGFVRSGRAIWGHWFFVALLALVFVRNMFHLGYFVLIAGTLAMVSKAHRRTVVLCGIAPLLIILGLYLKNWVLFGSFSGSTWMGMNMDTITAHQLTGEEANGLIRRRVISPVARIDLGAPIRYYEPYLQTPQPTGIAVLDDCVTSTGATNFNCLPFLQVQSIYMRDGVALLRNYPVVYLRSFATAWFTYFLPAGDFPFFDLNRPKIASLDRWWNLIFFGQVEEASDRKEMRRLAADGNRFSLVLYTGIFLMTGLPALWIWGVCYLVRGVRRKTLDPVVAMLIGFMLFNIAYITAISNLLSSFENNRYRFPLDAFYLVLLGIALTKVQRRLGARWS